MSISNEIERINGNVQTTLQTIADTGVAVPAGANSNNLPTAAAALANEKQDKNVGAGYANQLLYVGNDGVLTMLVLGSNLSIVDGKLNATGGSSGGGAALCGQAICGEATCGVDGVPSACIKAAEINGEGHLIITLASGKEIDAGMAKGADGEDGHTPVRGTDYYTEADKAEMVNAVIASLPTWEGGSY